MRGCVLDSPVSGNAGIGQSTEAVSRSRPGVQGRGEEKRGVTARGAGPECFGIK